MPRIAEREIYPDLPLKQPKKTSESGSNFSSCSLANTGLGL